MSTTQPQQTQTRGQLERALCQNIQALYRDQLGHRTGKISCQLFDNRLMVVVEDSITQPEQLLAKEGQSHLVKQVRTELDDAIQPKLKQVIETVLSVDVIDVLSDATLETGRTGIIAILAAPPAVRTSGPSIDGSKG